MRPVFLCRQKRRRIVYHKKTPCKPQYKNISRASCKAKNIRRAKRTADTSYTDQSFLREENFPASPENFFNNHRHTGLPETPVFAVCPFAVLFLFAADGRRRSEIFRKLTKKPTVKILFSFSSADGLHKRSKFCGKICGAFKEPDY